MNRFYSLVFIFIVSCDSTESPTLRECRNFQDNLLRRTAQADSLLNAHKASLFEQSTALSTDSLLASDSLLRLRYANMKESANQLEFKQAELHSWREQLVLLPSQAEITQGIRNPFGENSGDAGILMALNAYSDTLSILETSISELIRTTTYERTAAPKPQE